ncbi:hypothetical protein TC41_0208 [Alicyclobacillus acidocaldarius subsp. acidocaldarius Tc-4-1]|uniref:Uncharacterized protein n=1 Tax=Alicyclobacillus acidocaldarius (strain Tc-4-1) TaxID=1048834 RepID=F8IJ35_ALIAT|nr:hypothetical protein TC41_0208 [Alicyclobacillus acidocaldarius subsp. acidocaldarius Tc-4-1]
MIYPHNKKDFYETSYLSREECVVFARDEISHSAKGSIYKIYSTDRL